MENIAVILSGGRGSRFGGDQPKQFAKLAGKMVIEYTVDVFQKNHAIDSVVIVVQPDFIDFTWDLAKKNNWTKVRKIITDGEDRFDSVYSAIKSMVSFPESTKILIHDGIRPLVHPGIIYNCLDTLDHFEAVDVVVPSTDNLVEIYDNNLIKNIPDRTTMRRSQTPQGFRLGVLRTAFDKALLSSNKNFTSECGVVRAMIPQVQVATILGNHENIKIVFPIDLYMAEKILHIGQATESTNSPELSWLAGKSIVVFGGSSGIGQEVVNLARIHKANVYSASRSQNNINIVDINKVRDYLNEVFEESGKIDYVINCAGILIKRPIDLMSMEEIKSVVDINFLGAINIAISAKKYLKSTKGCLLNFSSSSYTRGRSLYAAYSSSKAAVVNLTQALSEEWADDGIRVNCINPERTATPMRSKNFGAEPVNTLLEPRTVAMASLNALKSDQSGVIFDVTLNSNR